MFGLIKRIGMAAAGGAAIPGGLSGSYDLRGSTLFGYVRALPFVTNAGVIVEVMRHGKVIAQCTTGPDPGNARLPFELDIAGRFTREEIAHDSITVSVRSRRGDTGTLTLAGATQLELVRTYLGVPVETMLDLDFSRHGNARPHLGEGWSGAEDSFTWTLGLDSFVHFRSPAAPGTYLLRLTCGAFITPMRPTQKMDILINHAEVAAFAAISSAASFYEFRIRADNFVPETETVLRLHHPYAGTPAEHFNSTDNRQVAFSMRRLTLARLIAAD
jgi:hypothetical protein